MKEYRVTWRQCPSNFNPGRVLFVEAASEEDARQIAHNHIERRFGIDWFTIFEVEETKPVPAGSVRE